jgi:hypothetical protein
VSISYSIFKKSMDSPLIAGQASLLPRSSSSSKLSSRRPSFIAVAPTISKSYLLLSLEFVTLSNHPLRFTPQSH